MVVSEHVQTVLVDLTRHLSRAWVLTYCYKIISKVNSHETEIAKRPDCRIRNKYEQIADEDVSNVFLWVL